MSLPKSSNEILNAAEVNQLGPFGNWSSRSKNTIYLAETDGYVIGYSREGVYGGASNTTVSVSPNSNLYPETILSTASSNDDTPIDYYGGFMVPVKKGYYWRVYCNGISGSTTVFWLPVGS
jgi:hypothetical protein